MAYKKSKISRYCELVVLINEKSNHLKVMAGDFYDGGHSFEEINKITIDELKTLEEELEDILCLTVDPKGFYQKKWQKSFHERLTKKNEEKM